MTREQTIEERMKGGIEQFAKEYGVEPLAFAIAIGCVREKHPEFDGERFEEEVKAVSSLLNKLLPFLDLTEVKSVLQERANGNFENSICKAVNLGEDFELKLKENGKGFVVYKKS